VFPKSAAHGIRWADSHTHEATYTEIAGDHHYSLVVHSNSAGGANRHASLALIADIHVRGIGLIMNLDAGKAGIVLFEVKICAGTLANVAGNAFLGVCFQYFHHLILLCFRHSRQFKNPLFVVNPNFAV